MTYHKKDILDLLLKQLTRMFDEIKLKYRCI